MNDKARRELVDAGVLEMARGTVEESVMIAAAVETGPPSGFIASPEGLSTLLPLGDDEESQQVTEALFRTLARYRGEINGGDRSDNGDPAA